MIVAPFSTSSRLALSAAGFIATSTSGASPGVRMSREAKWIWNAATPATGPAGGRAPGGGIGGAVGRADLGGEVRQRREVVAEHRGRVGEAATGKLHSVAGISGEANDYALA